MSKFLVDEVELSYTIILINADGTLDEIEEDNRVALKVDESNIDAVANEIASDNKELVSYVKDCIVNDLFPMVRIGYTSRASFFDSTLAHRGIEGINRHFAFIIRVLTRHYVEE